MRAQRAWLALLVLVVILVPAAAAGNAKPAKHKMAVTLDYDFQPDHACKPKVKSLHCVQQFNIYEISGPRPILLFSIVAPRGADKPVRGIKGKSAPAMIKPGTYTFAATAYMGDGSESDPKACKVTVTVGSPTQVSLNLRLGYRASSGT